MALNLHGKSPAKFPVFCHYPGNKLEVFELSARHNLSELSRRYRLGQSNNRISLVPRKIVLCHGCF